MDDNMKMLLEQKKIQQKIRRERLAIQRLREDFAQNIARFDEKYRYADEVEAAKIQDFISRLDFVRPGQLDIKESACFLPNNVYLCFLMGTSALFEIYIFGKYADIISDYDEWKVFSPYLLLVDEDLNHYTYINDCGEIMGSQIV